jgi:hypothetical protein
MINRRTPDRVSADPSVRPSPGSLHTMPAISHAVARLAPVAASPPPRTQPLTDAEFGCVQDYCARVMNDIVRLGLSIHIEHDLHAFARLRRRMGDGFCYPSLDPTQCRIGPDAFWLHACDDAGETTAILAARVFAEVDDFYRLMTSETLWWDRRLHPVGRCRPLRSIPAFGGTVGHSGGMWVSPTQRGRGLPKLMQGLSRGLQLRNHAIDVDTGLVFEPLVTFALRQYQYPRCELVIDGYFPPAGKDARVYLCHMTRAEALSSMGFAALDDAEPLGAVA